MSLRSHPDVAAGAGDRARMAGAWQRDDGRDPVKLRVDAVKAQTCAGWPRTADPDRACSGRDIAVPASSGGRYRPTIRSVAGSTRYVTPAPPTQIAPYPAASRSIGPSGKCKTPSFVS